MSWVSFIAKRFIWVQGRETALHTGMLEGKDSPRRVLLTGSFEMERKVGSILAQHWGRG